MSDFFHRLHHFLSFKKSNANHSRYEDFAGGYRLPVAAQDLGVIQGSYMPGQDPLNSAQHAYSGPAASDQAGRNQENNFGIFSYAHGSTINNPVIAEQIQLSDPSSALEWIEGHAMSGVEYHSSARNPPPRCHDGTRAKFITTTELLLSDPNTKERFLFLYGPAGVGKSAIVQTLAERQEKSGAVCASLFFPQLTFSSPSIGSPGESSRVWLTISYRLATLNSSYLAYVNEQVKHDPKLVEANMQYLFQKLIAEPIGQRHLLKSFPLLPIFIDGWDQCRGQEMQTQILQLIGKLISDYPSAPLLWIITSRPDRYILKEIEELSLQGHTKTYFIPVDSDDAYADVTHFLQSEFTGLKKHYDIADPSPWPTEHDFSRVLVSVSGYFMIASAITRFVGNRKASDPVTQLETVVSAVSLPISAPKHIGPVHEMYTKIVETVSSDHYRTAKRILGFYLLSQPFGAFSRQSTSFWMLCNILNIKQNVAYACLSSLLSVLDVPEPRNAFDSPMRFFHTSFAEFLSNRDASKEFWIDMKEVVVDLWQRHSRILQQTNIPGAVQ
ncbi:hypothetical protein P691DRAFT_759123 [Macrolepiota fuliginosa MF-IS2]|uniref:Nephrocystin 3-like N-terminal domain-containing protein n=1 Tax=Macrolepiota fuliginosa MF-IS2 TaxID=1400762 RepID=A0A9P6C5L4_9AGAR|nr:hypothetical protein P691DRAFT_759123 [Macrolepiota fuliginosa MF-IS2]